ncbi:MAG: GrpB family protein [Solirubrobacterales bacterium]|nr:GrpB family protein [Solirubrobacterales bacterium]MBV9806266.1 GrpB family protein [Solirubrobacterales bacterium]
MLRSTDITTFNDSPPPPGESPWVVGRDQTTELGLAPYDASWPARYEVLAGLIRSALGPAVLALDHVGSTSVPGLDAKPIIDVDLTVADGGAEPTHVPALEACGFQLVGREPWWYGHRLLHHSGPACNLHVWSPDCPESARHLIFRDWLRANPDECELYVRAKRAASEQTVTVGGDVEAYNAHKQAVIRQIYRRAFTALGLA